MDPNKTLKDALEKAQFIINTRGLDLTEVGEELAERVIDLDRWLRQGGFLPEAWEQSKYKHWRSLLQTAAASINKNEGTKVCDLEVAFIRDGEELVITDLQTALDWIANDITWGDSENDWRDAQHLEVRPL